MGAVVLAYGAAGDYLAVLRSLSEQGVAPERVLVVHNPSEPGERLSPPDGCEVIEASHNLGYAAGMNLGIRRQLEGDAELVLLLTHDASLRSGALEALVAASECERGYGVLAPALLFTGTETPFSFGGRIGPSGALSHIGSRPPAPGGIAPCDWVDGGTMLIRAEALARAEGFDERLWGYCEDADLCLRIARAGFGVGVVVEAEADQAPGGAKRPGPWAYLLTRNGLAFAWRARGVRGVAAMLLRAAGLIASELARTAARLTPLRPGSPTETWPVAVGAARGCLDFLRGRWGPPPSLPGGGDMKNLERPGA